MSMRWPSSKGISRRWQGSSPLREEGLQGVEGQAEGARGRIYKRLKRAKKPIDIKQHEVEQEMFVSLKATPTSHIPRQFLKKWKK